MGLRNAFNRGPGWRTHLLMRWPVLYLLLAIGCGDSASTGGDDDDVAGGVDAGPGGPNADAGPIETATGCAGVFNADQVLDYHLELAAGDWATVRGDLTFSIEVAAQFRCDGEAAKTVGLRRKRSGGTDKVGLKVDMNELGPGQSHYGLRKLSLENGESSGSASDAVDARALVSEYLSWRLMALSGAVTGRAVFARVFVNGELIGVYVNVEQVDKRFLRDRLGDDSGWLYKKSGGAGDGFKTHETDGLDDPYDDYFCFWGSGNTCAPPSAAELASELPARLEIPQMLRVGAVNALIQNTDGIIAKDNNYYWYDRHTGGRVYLPWDLDTTMNQDMSLFPDSTYTQVLFTHWRPDYEATLAELVDGPLSLAAILAEIDRADQVAGPAFATDPYVTGSMGGAADDLRAYWTAQHAGAAAEVGGP
jgi:hypothetical protein